MLSESERDSSSSTAQCSGSCNESDISLEALKNMHLERIKTQILKKLRLDAPPNISRPLLPEFLNLQLALNDIDSEAENTFNKEDFYGTTDEVVIFLDPDGINSYCRTKNTSEISQCFQLRLAPDLEPERISLAELWIYVFSNSNLDDCKLVKISNLTDEKYQLLPLNTSPQLMSKSFNSNATDAAKQWLKFNLTSMVQSWVESGNLAHKLRVTCESVYENVDDDAQKSFLIIKTDSEERISIRNKRNTNCPPNATLCCREHLHVSFNDFGWNQWIISPLNYTANFCYGDCADDVSASMYLHTTVMHSVLHSTSPTKPNVMLKLCCAPAKLKPLSIIYLTQQNYVYKKVLPNMIVESCACA